MHNIANGMLETDTCVIFKGKPSVTNKSNISSFISDIHVSNRYFFNNDKNKYCINHTLELV